MIFQQELRDGACKKMRAEFLVHRQLCVIEMDLSIPTAYPCFVKETDVSSGQNTWYRGQWVILHLPEYEQLSCFAADVLIFPLRAVSLEQR